MTTPTYILKVDCKDKAGIVAAVSTSLYENHCNIEDSAQFNDHISGHFFMRTEFSAPKESQSIDNFKNTFKQISQKFNMEWSLTNSKDKPKTIIMVSKANHCLQDIIYRVESELLPIEITAIVSNHKTLEPLAKLHNINFHHIEVTPKTKKDAETRLNKIIKDTGSELTILARYMQILSDDFCTKHKGRIINIHHSFLPSFKGASPYHQAHNRGVKLIGASAHFVTANLDEGPIIEQETERITHAANPEAMRLIGKDIESRTLAKALKFYAERRIFQHGKHTIIL